MYEKQNWLESKYKKIIRLSDYDHKWIKENKKKKSAAGFLEHIINQYREGLI